MELNQIETAKSGNFLDLLNLMIDKDPYFNNLTGKLLNNFFRLRRPRYL